MAVEAAEEGKKAPVRTGLAKGMPKDYDEVGTANSRRRIAIIRVMSDECGEMR